MFKNASMKSNVPIAVASRSFSRHPQLRAELLEEYFSVRFNDDGVALEGTALIEFARGREKLIIGLERVSEAFLERDRWAGAKVPYVRVGARGVRYQPSALETYITSQVRRPAR